MLFITKILQDKENPVLQFVKYGCCGVTAFAVDTTIFYLLAIFVFFSLKPDDPVALLFNLDIAPISEGLRIRNFWIGKSCSFFCANGVAYILNVLFVFEGGRHKVHHEIVLFFVVSLVSFLLGTWTGDLLIRFFGVQTTYSQFTAVIFATLINYGGRKFFIFKS
jgi:putative flippase GtrA